MGLADREYMRDIPAYRQVTGRARVGPRTALATAVSLGLVLLGTGYFGVRPHLGALPYRSPLYAPRTFHLNGPTSMTAGELMNMTGTLPPGVSGVIVVQAHWPAGPWQTLGTTQSVDGAYRLRYELSQPGVVDVRVALPNGDYATTEITVFPAAAAGSPAA